MDHTSPSWNFSTVTNYLEDNDSIDYTDELVFLCDHGENIMVYSSWITAVCYIFIFILSVAGNSLVFCILVKFESLRRVTNLFVLNLAVSDLVFATTLPFWITYHLSHWIFGDFLCKLVSGMFFIGLYSSLMFLVAITVDRYMIIVHKQQDAGRKRLVYARAICTVIWLGSVGASLREMIFSSASQDINQMSICESREDGEQNGNNYLHMLFSFFLPLIIIIFCYSLIMKTVALSRNKKKHKTFAFIICIVVVFFVCWGPYNIVIFLMPIIHKGDCSYQRQLHLVFISFRILAYSHCCVNPILYTCTDKFRGHIYNIFCNSLRQRGTNSNHFSAVQSISNFFEKEAANNDNICMSKVI